MTTLRHRALPVGEDLPEPLRDSEATGKPGYKGRKRGDSRLLHWSCVHAPPLHKFIQRPLN